MSIYTPVHPVTWYTKIMFETAKTLINNASRIVVIQPENPDGDSLASALALEDILSEAGKEVSLFCSIDIPKYLRYINGWDRVEKDWPKNQDLAIIVDTTSALLLQQTLDTPSIRSFLESHPSLIFDHHQESANDLPFTPEFVINSNAIAASQVIYDFAVDAELPVTPVAAEALFIALQADSLGLTTQSVTPEAYQVAADLVKLGAVPADIEGRRREYMKKPAEILEYKGRLIERIEYDLDGVLATVHIPWEEIEEYSDRYNPSVLVLEEMRLVDTVQVAVAFKTYPDGKVTGKIRTNAPIAHHIAGYFGGGGHEYAAGFKVFEDFQTIRTEIITATQKALTDIEE